MAKPGKDIIDLKNSIQLRTAVEGALFLVLYSTSGTPNRFFFIIYTILITFLGEVMQCKEKKYENFSKRSIKQGHVDSNP